MIHPDTRLVYINDEIGYGVFATAFIPKGTITYVKDSLELEISPEEFLAHSAPLQQAIEKYSYIDERGYRIVSWDFGKYVNHCCNCNTMSTGYGFEIAIRDIHPGEEITDEYGLFNLIEPMTLSCKQNGCRKVVSKEDIDKYWEIWDEKIKDALSLMSKVAQPLMPFIDSLTLEDIEAYLYDQSLYKSVASLKYDLHQNNVQLVGLHYNKIGH